MFDRSAAWYDAFYHWVDYTTEAALVAEAALALQPGATSLLDVACGTGGHLEHFAATFPDCAGVDIEPAMIERARARLPDSVRLEVADMRSLDLGRSFDVVTCLFSSIGYVRHRAGLNTAVARLGAHVAPGGVLVIEPWVLADDWLDPGPATIDVVDHDGGKLARAIVSSRDGDLSRLDIHYVMARPGEIVTADERHELGLFTRNDYLDAITAAGMTADFEPYGLRGRGLIVAT